MLEFYKKAISIFLVLLLITGALTLICVAKVFVSDSLFPKGDSVVPWELETITDQQKGGTSSVVVNNAGLNLDYDYILTSAVQYPHVTQVFAFSELNNAQNYADLSGYSSVTLKLKCQPQNLLSLHFHTFDPQVTEISNFSSYRIAEALINCEDEWENVEIDLRYLNVREWWLWEYKLEVSDQRYWLDKTLAISIGTSRQGPIEIPANVQINEFILHKRDWHYIWILIVFSSVIWILFFSWLFKQFTYSLIADVKRKLRNDLPLIAYQQLTIEPHNDEEKSQILRFIATEYSNPDLSQDMAIASLGIKRSKFNEVLKEELGFTFSAYLNRIRLSEAARLLSETEDANVAEIAYSVGYNNVSYFNKLFKNEYGCTPKTFKTIYLIKKSD